MCSVACFSRQRAWQASQHEWLPHPDVAPDAVLLLTGVEDAESVREGAARSVATVCAHVWRLVCSNTGIECYRADGTQPHLVFSAVMPDSPHLELPALQLTLPLRDTWQRWKQQRDFF